MKKSIRFSVILMTSFLSLGVSSSASSIELNSVNFVIGESLALLLTGGGLISLGCFLRRIKSEHF